MSKKLTKAEFVVKAIQVHGDLYKYSNVVYEGNKVKVEILCENHGVFFQKPNNHISLKQGCPKCKASKHSNRSTKNFNSFYEKAKNKFGEKFEYDESCFSGFSISTKIVCKKHGEIDQTPYRHLASVHGCMECSREFNTKLPKELRLLVKRAKGVIQQSFIRKNFPKKSRTYELLGCTWEEFKKHLEDNPYGFTIYQKGLDLDHIVPISSAKDEMEVEYLNRYTNFQLLPSKYNRNIKKTKPFNKEGFEEWLKTII
jgi:hypothetical protein